MANSKSFLKHEALNVITQLYFLMDDLESPDTQINMRSRLELLTFFVAEETFILKEERDFFREEVDMAELVLMLKDILTSDLEVHQATLEINDSTMTVRADFECLKNGLKYIFKYLIGGSRQVRVDLSSEKRQMCIHSKLDVTIKWMEGDFLDFLRGQKDPSIILMEGYLRLLRHSGIEIEISRDRMTLQF